MPKPKTLKLPKTFEFAVSELGTRIASLGKNVVLADPTTMKRISLSHPLPHPSHAAFSPDGKYLAVKSTSGRLVLLDANNGELIYDFENTKDGEGPGPMFSACSRYVVDASWGGNIFVRDTIDRTTENRDSFGNEMIKDVLASADRETWAFVHYKRASTDADSGVSYVSLWSWPLSKKAVMHPTFGSIYASALSPDGSTLAVAGYSDLQFLYMNSNENARTIPLEGCKRIQWSPDGTLLGLVLASSISIRKYPSLEEIHDFNIEYASDVAFGVDQSFLALGSWNEGIVVPFPTSLSTIHS